MLIAVASQNRKQVTGHTGRCHRFWVYQVEGGEIKQKDFLELPKEQSFHYASPHEAHELDRIDVLICGGLGQGLVQKLARKNIEVISTEETDIEKAVADYLSGNLSQLSPEAHSHGHDHHHEAHDHSFVQLSTGGSNFDNAGNMANPDGEKKHHGGGCHH